MVRAAMPGSASAWPGAQDGARGVRPGHVGLPGRAQREGPPATVRHARTGKLFPDPDVSIAAPAGCIPGFPSACIPQQWTVSSTTSVHFWTGSTSVHTSAHFCELPRRRRSTGVVVSGLRFSTHTPSRRARVQRARSTLRGSAPTGTLEHLQGEFLIPPQIRKSVKPSCFPLF